MVLRGALVGTIEELLLNPLATLAAVGLGAIVIGFLLLLRRRGQSRTTEGYAKSGNYLAAANEAQRDGNLEVALEYLLLAKQPARAAQVAEKLGRPQQAGEIYESIGELARAADLYAQAGLRGRADELRRTLEESEPGPRAGDAESRDSTDEILTDSQYAARLEKKLKRLRAEAERGSDKALGELMDVGREAGELFLASGENERAAEVFRDAGLIDQAINVYINLLGDFGAAAALFAQRGDHDRAAEFYQEAGLRERALAAWGRWAEAAPDPLEHIEQVDQLGVEATCQFLETVVDQRPLSDETVDLHYRVAEAFEHREALEPAYRLLEQIARAIPDYRDVGQRIDRLQVRMGSGRDRAAGEGRGRSRSATPPPEPRDGAIGTADTKLGRPARRQPGGQESAGSYQFRAERSKPERKAGPGAGRRDERGAGFDDPRLGAGEGSSSPISVHLDAASLRQLVKEMIDVTTRDSRRPSSIDEVIPVEVVDADARSRRLTSPRAHRERAQGLEITPISLELVVDRAVDDARRGMSARELEQMLGDQPPSLQNIEVWYRLGLAYAAAGSWTKALKAFQVVEDISPGYRDALARCDELEAWQTKVSLHAAQDQTLSQRYTLLGELGRGGMAVVYRARDEALGRELALKFLSEEVSSRSGMVELFQREARAAAQLNHPNIVTVYDVGQISDRTFIAMELVEGETIEDLLDRQGRLKIVDALRISEKILDALSYAHSKRIVHRDIKPSNIMRTSFNVVKLMDFGLAKSLEYGPKTTAVCGTPLYMAPEQFVGRNIDARTDVFATGATIYEMITGTPPFTNMLRDRPPKRLSSVVQKVPAVIDKMVARSLEFDRKNRFAHAGEMLEITRGILEQINSRLDED